MEKASNPIVVLAFSGGLDTSYCVKYLIRERGLNVHTVFVNTGGFSRTELDVIERRAWDLGASQHVTLDGREPYYAKIIKYLIFGNVLRGGSYPLSVGAERVYQAIALANYARGVGAKYIAHGSTGAGNDQVRFDLIFEVLVPELEILTPIRDKQLTRKEEIDYLKSQGFHWTWKKAQYSINKGLWGTTIGGVETLTSNLPLPEEAYPSYVKTKESKDISLLFEKGELRGINGKKMNPLNVIHRLGAIATEYSIGRGIHTGDTIIGIKGRVAFEAGAASIAIQAHHILEKHTLAKWQLHWKQQLGDWYGMFIHEGQYFDPVMRNIERFLEDTQINVTGKVYVTVYPFGFSVAGIDSPHDLMASSMADYGEMNKAWTGDDVRGFTKMLANSLRIYKDVNGFAF